MSRKALAFGAATLMGMYSVLVYVTHDAGYDSSSTCYASSEYECYQVAWLGCEWDVTTRTCGALSTAQGASKLLKKNAKKRQKKQSKQAAAATAAVAKPPGSALDAECRTIPLVVIGLYIFKGNSKHKPHFFTSRLFNTLTILGEHGLSTVLFTGGEANSNGKLSKKLAENAFYKNAKKGRNKYTSKKIAPYLWYNVSEVDDLPYKVLSVRGAGAGSSDLAAASFNFF